MKKKKWGETLTLVLKLRPAGVGAVHGADPVDLVLVSMGEKKKKPSMLLLVVCLSSWDVCDLTWERNFYISVNIISD